MLALKLENFAVQLARHQYLRVAEGECDIVGRLEYR
jgi:hypothetical protein